ncbi:MAG: helix-turn-helix transcriptional regulator [Eudoraea sp.]|nr:helix-turn-helix transcriptional regulator [Eudoraea sp.]
MVRFLVVFTFLLCLQAEAQYLFSGELAEKTAGKTVYLSLVEDYRRSSRIYFDQIIRKTTTDSLGQFFFEGNNLSAENRLYRIHIDECQDQNSPDEYFLGNCPNSQSVLFLANNRDTLSLPATFANELFCAVESTNTASDKILEIEAMKEEMILDFTEVRSEANTRLNLETWFQRWQEYGETLQEPVLELYIYDFLSDRTNETYDYYLEEVGDNPYYEELLGRLEAQYPEASFTNAYRREMLTDRLLSNPQSDDQKQFLWFLGALLSISLLLNIYLLTRKTNKGSAIETDPTKLTQQERKIAHQVLEDKTNKEIADALFISVSTVRTHINNLNKKLGVADREALKVQLQQQFPPGD